MEWSQVMAKSQEAGRRLRFTATPSRTSSQGGEGEPQGEGAALCGSQQCGDQPQGQVHPEEGQGRDDPRGDTGRGLVSSV